MEEFKGKINKMSKKELICAIQSIETERSELLLKKNVALLRLAQLEKDGDSGKGESTPSQLSLGRKKTSLLIREEPEFVLSTEILANPSPPKTKAQAEKLQIVIREILLKNGKMPLSEIVSEVNRDYSNDNEDIYLCVQKMTKSGKAFLTFISGKRFYLADPAPIIKPA